MLCRQRNHIQPETLKDENWLACQTRQAALQIGRLWSMQKAPDNTEGSKQTSGHSSAPTGATPQLSHNRTAAAGREFLRALGSDLGGLALRLRQYRWRSRL